MSTEQADARRDGRTCLARPNSQARTTTGNSTRLYGVNQMLNFVDSSLHASGLRKLAFCREPNSQNPYFLLSFFHITYSRWTSSLPSCLWSQRIFPSLPGPRLTIFLSRCKFSTLTTRQPMVEIHLLTFPRFPLRKKEHKSYFGKNRTHDFRTSRCASYPLDHSGDDINMKCEVHYNILLCGMGAYILQFVPSFVFLRIKNIVMVYYMDAIAGSGRNPPSKRHIQPEYGAG